MKVHCVQKILKHPRKLIDTTVSNNNRIAWLAEHALKRLGFATVSEIKHFWDTTNIKEIRTWCERNADRVSTASVESWSGEYCDALTLASNKKLLNSSPKLSKRIRILNPFDPIVRDRKRLARLFNFDYRIEIYIPAKKRQFGYYVYPLLEYDKFVGRIEVRHDKTRNIICVDNLWHESKVVFGKQRMNRLGSELERLKRFCGADAVEWSE